MISGLCCLAWQGCSCGGERRAGARAAACGYIIAFLFLLAYYGSFIDFTRTLTPLRFIIMMNVYLVLPASAALCCLYPLDAAIVPPG